MNSLNQVLENALQLPYEQQEMLIKILQNRHQETRRRSQRSASRPQKKARSLTLRAGYTQDKIGSY